VKNIKTTFVCEETLTCQWFIIFFWENAFKIKGQVARRTYAATFLEKEVFVYKDQDCSNLRLIVRFSKEEHLGTIILGVTESQGKKKFFFQSYPETDWESK
jgi:hypothetical protein